MTLYPDEKKFNYGLLIMRIGLASVLLLHAFPILFSGPESWVRATASLHFIKLNIAPQTLGLIVLCLEILGGLSLITGYFFRIACSVLAILYGFYFVYYYFTLGYVTLPFYTIGLFAVYCGMMLTGAGRYSVSLTIEKKTYTLPDGPK